MIGSGLAASSARGLAVHTATHLVQRDGQLVGAVYGLLTPTQAQSVVNRLLISDDPGRIAQDLPWAVVVIRADRTIAATASTMLSSGLFHTVANNGQITVATDPGLVARHSERRFEPDPEALKATVAMGTQPDTTPISGIHRTVPGITVSWRRGRRSMYDWLGPATLPTPDREGERLVSEYRSAFDAVIDGLVADEGPLVATLSGGLDSTFMVASLARHANSTRPLEAYCHSPLPAAMRTQRHLRNADDYTYAMSMAARYPSAIHLHALRNEDEVHPLDAAADAFRSSWLPVAGPANMVWLNAFTEAAEAQSARIKFHARMGNASFSHPHSYAVRYYLRRGQVPTLLALASPRRGARSWRSGVSRRIVQPLAAGAAPSADDRLKELGIPPYPRGGRARPGTRAAFIQTLLERRSANPALSNPALSHGVLRVDPFAARSIVELAASMTPRQWQTGPGDRAFARRCGEGRVPDDIRLRQTRGGQGLDTWYVVRRTPDRLSAALDTAFAEPAFNGWLEPARLSGWWRAACERSPLDPPPLGLIDVLRLASAAEYARWLRTRRSN